MEAAKKEKSRINTKQVLFIAALLTGALSLLVSMAPYPNELSRGFSFILAASSFGCAAAIIYLFLSDEGA